jgi:hypothetical protein
MSSEERFKKSLEEKLSSKEFPFDEDNWENARGMIDAYKKARRPPVPASFVFLAGLFLIVSVVGTMFFFSDALFRRLELSLLKDPFIEEPSAPVPAITPNEQALPAVAPSVKNTPPEPALAGIPATHKRTETGTSLPAPAFEAASSFHPHTITETTAAPPAGNRSKDQPLSRPEPELTGSAGPPAATAFTPSDSAEPVAQAETSSALSPGESISSPVSDSGPASETRQENKNSSLAEVSGNSPEEALSATAPTEIPAIVPNNKEEETPQEEVLAVAGPDTLRETPPAPVVLAPSRDSSLQMPLLPGKSSVLFSAETGASYMFGWKTPSSRDANGFNPVVGLNVFMNQLLPRTSLSFGMHYSSVSNLSYSHYTAKIVRFGLGEESHTSVFTPVKLHYLMTPLRFHYHMNAVSSIGAGCLVAYLLDVESEIETYTERFNQKLDQNIIKASGYTEGFRKYDAQLSLFYNHKLYPFLGLNLEVFYGLTDIKNTSFFNSSGQERNSGIKLTLVYNFLKKNPI